MTLHADPAASASYRHAIEHLSGPYIDAARDQAVPLDEAGHASLDGPLRQPMLLLACVQSLGAQALAARVTVTLNTLGSEPLSPTIHFGPYTEAGACLPLWASDPVASDAMAHPGFSVDVTLLDDALGQAPSAVLELRVVEGLLGRTIYLLGAEKLRVRRLAREIAAARTVSTASANALDRLGADLGIARLQERLEWDAPSGEPVSRPLREPDADFRQRLAVFMPFFLPHLRRVQRALNGDATHVGLLAPMGFAGEVVVTESNAELAVAVRLVASGPTAEAQRLDYLGFVRAVHLVKPGHTLPPWSLLPSLEIAQTNAMLHRLGISFAFPDESYICRPLAEALDLLGRVRIALGVTRPWLVRRAQDDTGGSRFELGLGVDVEGALAAELDQMAAQLQSGVIPGPVDVRLQVLLESLQPVPSAQDPAGRWLLAPCGLRTVHSTAQGLYLSHLPIHGLLIDTVEGPALTVAARLAAPGDVDQHSHLFHALAGSLAEAAAAGVGGLSVLSAAQAQAAFAQAQLSATPAFERAGLHIPASPEDLARAVSGLAAVPPELMVTLQLDASFSAGLIANADDQVRQLTTLVAALRRNEVVSALPLVTGASGVVVALAVQDLPGEAVILNSRAPGFRWHVLPVRGPVGGLEATRGARNRYFAPAEVGLAALVMVALVRPDREDPRDVIAPYEVRLDLPVDQNLNLPQFELLMNVVQRMVPLGVRIDTHALRESHIDPAGDGHPVAFTGLLSRAWRNFRQPRQIGFVNSDLQG